MRGPQPQPTVAEKPTTALGWLVALWGASGVAYVLIHAVVRLIPVAVEGIRGCESVGHWLAVAASVASLGYFEGYRAFQKRYAPRVIARAFYIGREPFGLSSLLAPLFCMAFFRATRPLLIVSWAVAFGVVAIVLVVSRLPQPWRGAIDAGVVIGLSWGVVSMIVYWILAMRDRPLPEPAGVP